MNPQAQFRFPTEPEQQLLERLLDARFPGRDELIPMIRNLLVKIIDDEGSLELQTQQRGMAPVAKRIPVEAEARDEDGTAIHVLLHVLKGKPAELEIFKEDGSPVKRMPPASAFEPLVLPGVPSEHY